MTIRVVYVDERIDFDYRCPCRALDDPCLRALMEDGATASVWTDDKTMCVVPEVTGWDRLCEKLIVNAATLLR